MEEEESILYDESASALPSPLEAQLARLREQHQTELHELARKYESDQAVLNDIKEILLATGTVEEEDGSELRVGEAVEGLLRSLSEAQEQVRRLESALLKEQQRGHEAAHHHPFTSAEAVPTSTIKAEHLSSSRGVQHDDEVEEEEARHDPPGGGKAVEEPRSDDSWGLDVDSEEQEEEEDLDEEESRGPGLTFPARHVPSPGGLLPASSSCPADPMGWAIMTEQFRANFKQFLLDRKLSQTSAKIYCRIVDKLLGPTGTGTQEGAMEILQDKEGAHEFLHTRGAGITARLAGERQEGEHVNARTSWRHWCDFVQGGNSMGLKRKRDGASSAPHAPRLELEDRGVLGKALKQGFVEYLVRWHRLAKDTTAREYVAAAQKVMAMASQQGGGSVERVRTKNDVILFVEKYGRDIDTRHNDPRSPKHHKQQAAWRYLLSYVQEGDSDGE